MADLRLQIQADSRRAQQDVDSLRREIQTLRTQLGQVQQGSTSAGTAIDEMGDESAQTARQVRSLGDATSRTNRETQNASRGFTSATGGTQNFTRSLGGLGSILGGLGVAVVGSELIDLGRGFVTAASRVEGFRNGLTALYGDAQIANNVLSDLEGLAELPGITFEGAVQGALRLQTVGVEGERANAVIREFGNAAALAGNGSEELGRAMIGLSQSISRGRIDQENLNQILENVPLIGNSIREAFGTIEAQNIQAQLDAAGQSVQDFTDIVTNQLAQGARASADSTANAFSNLGNSVFRLQAEIGSQFLGSVRDATVGLSNFLDTIRRGVTDVSTLPQPIQDIVEGAQALFEALQRVGTTIANTLGPPLAFLGENLGSLLGEVLELAAALYTALEPAFRVIHTITGVVVTAVGQLVEHISVLVRGITQAVEFLTFWQNEQDKIAASSENLTEKVGAATAALGESATASELFAAKLTDLNTELDGVNSEISNYEARLKSAREQAVGETNPSIQQLERRLAAARARAAELESQIGTTQTALDKQTTSTMAATAATKEAAVEFTTYAEAIRQVQANIEAYVEEQAVLTDFGTFWEIAAGQADGYTTAIDLTTVSVVNLKNELDALTTVFDEQNVVINENGVVLDEETQALLRFLATLDGLDESLANVESRLYAHNAALVNPAVSDAIDSLRDYNDVLLEAGINFQSVESISEDLTQSIRDQASAFDDLRRDVESAEISLDDIDETFNRIPDAIDPAIVSMEDFESVGLRALRSIGDELSAFEGDLGSIGIGIDNLVTLFANPINFAAGTLGAVFEGLSNINEFAGALGLPDDFFDDPVPGQAQVNPQNVAQNEQLAQQQIHQAGIARYLNAPDPLAQIELLRGNDPGIFQRFGTREFIEQNFPELVDVIYPRGQGFNQSGALAGRRGAQSFAEATGTDRQATEDAAILMYGPEDYAAEVAAATGEALSDIPEPDLPPEIADPLGTFSLTGDDRAALDPYEQAVRDAEDAIEDLTEDSTPQEIADAYQDLVFAQTNLSSVTEGIIRAAADAGRITGTAATNAIRSLESDLGDDLRTANNALIGSLGDIGFEVVGGIENIREAIDVSDISSVFRRIPEQIEEAVTAEPEPEPETAPALREVFSFSAGQRRILGPLNAAVSDAEEFIRDFITEDSTPEEIQAAYTALTTAEQALYDQQVQFITNATHITEETRTGALAAAGRDFNGDIRDANQTLVRALGNVGFELVNALTFTSGILMGSAAAIQQIPVEAEAAAEEAEPEADEVDPLAPLRSNARLAANQVRRSRTALGQATDEQDFEDRRVNLIQAVNAAYTAQIALLDALGLSEADYQDRFEDAEDARDSAITRATTSVNTFAEARIKGEEDAAEAAQDAADEKIAADERAERERMRIAERAARESQRTEERLADDIADLRDDAVDAEADRLESIEDLHDRHLNRVLGLETRFSRDLEDLRRDRIDDAEDIALEYQRDLEDLQNRFTRQLIDDAISFSDLTADQQRQVTESTGFQQGLFDLNRDRSRDRQDLGIESGILRPGSAGSEFYRQQIEGGQLTDQNLIEELFGRQGLDDFIGLERGVEDAETRLAQGLIDTTATYTDRITENTLAVEMLTNQLIAVGVSPQTPMEVVSPEMIATGISDAVMEGLSQPSQVDAELAMAAAPEAITLSADIVNINANSVNLNADIPSEAGSGREQRPVVNNITINSNTSDPEKLAQEVGDVIVKQQQQGRSLLGEGS